MRQAANIILRHFTQRYALVAVTCLLISQGWLLPARAQPTGSKAIQVVAFLNASTGLVSYSDSTGSTHRFSCDGDTYIAAIKFPSQLAIQDSDVAWATMGNLLLRGDKAWTRWTFIDSEYAHTFIGCAAGKLFLSSNGALYSATANGMTPDTGILDGDLFHALDYLSDKKLFLLTSRALYESNDGGYRWNIKFGLSGDGVYADRAHQLLYLGGPLRVSLDKGTMWTAIPDESVYPFVPLNGRIVGSHDCTGSFYVMPKGNVTDTYRYGEDGFFHDVGPRQLSTSARVFDGGAIVYDLGRGQTSYYTFTGIDGSQSDSAASNLVVIGDTIDVNLCSTRMDSLRLRIESRVCLPIAIDSIMLTSATGTLGKTSAHRLLAGNSTEIAVPYIPQSGGTDTVRLRVKVHSVEGRGYAEYVPVQAIVRVHASPAELTAPKSVDCGSVRLDSTHSAVFSIRNDGCEELRVDSIVSSRPTLFSIVPSAMPRALRAGDSLVVTVTYKPQTVGQDLESIEIGTSGGHRFVTVLGKGIQTLSVVEANTEVSTVRYVNGELLLNAVLSGTVEIVDILGVARREWHVEAGEQSLQAEALPAGVYFVRGLDMPAQRIQVLP